jgi:hypothetical protein
VPLPGGSNQFHKHTKRFSIFITVVRRQPHHRWDRIIGKSGLTADCSPSLQFS